MDAIDRLADAAKGLTELSAAGRAAAAIAIQEASATEREARRRLDDARAREDATEQRVGDLRRRLAAVEEEGSAEVLTRGMPSSSLLAEAQQERAAEVEAAYQSGFEDLRCPDDHQYKHVRFIRFCALCVCALTEFCSHAPAVSTGL